MKKLLTAALFASIGTLHAGGFRVSLQGVKQLAMAHTSAHTQDASVAFFNPAGISFIDSKLSVAAGAFMVGTKITYQNPSTLESFKTDNPISTPMYASIAYKPIENLSLGFSFTTPFGSSVKWDDKWAGKDIVQEIELKGYYFQPMASVKVTKWASVGASFIYAQGVVDWTKGVTSFNGNMNIIDEKAKGYGFSVGVYLKPTEKLDISLAYRSKVDVKAKNGKATFNISPSLYPLINANSEGKDKFTATLPLIEEFTVGLTYKITPRWSISSDFNYFGWSKYDALTLDFEKVTVGNQADNTVLVSPKDFKDVFAFRIGTEYMVTERLAARLGYYYDESPYDDNRFIPETPSFNANVVTGGIGYKFPKISIDFSGAYSFMQSRDAKNDVIGFYGQAKSRAFYFGLGVAYNPF